MNLFGLTITRSAKPQPAPVQRSLSAAQAWLMSEEPPTRPPLGNPYEQVVWVYRAVNALAQQVANVPFLFSRGERGREHLITSGPLVDFYNRPHPSLNRFQYWELRVQWLMLRGECMRIPIFRNPDGVHSPLRSPRSALQHVLLLDPASFRHLIEQRRLEGWRYTAPFDSPLESQIFLPEEVWFDRLPNPYDFWRGLPPLLVASLAAKNEFASAAFMHGVIDNNAENGLIVRTEQNLTDDQRDQISAVLRQRRSFAGTATRPVLLWGTTEIVQPRLSSADLQFLENRKFSRSEICAAFGVPEEIVTTTDHAKYDVMQGARLNFIENCVAPLCARLEAEEQKTIRLLDPDAIGWFDLDSLPIMQAARRTRMAAAKAAFDMGVPFNELNRIYDLGFRPVPWGDTGFIPSNYQKLGKLPSEDSQPKPAPRPNGSPSPAAPRSLVELTNMAQALAREMRPDNGTPKP